MTPTQSVNESPGATPAGAASSSQGRPASTGESLPVVVRKSSWMPDIGDATLAARSLAISFGIIAGVFLLLVPGAGVLAAVAVRHPDLVLTWPASLAISLGISLALLFVLTILIGLVGGRGSPFFMLLVVGMLITLGVVHHRDPALVDVLWNHLTR